jgi:hypothetical protein
VDFTKDYRAADGGQLAFIRARKLCLFFSLYRLFSEMYFNISMAFSSCGDAWILPRLKLSL